MSVHLHRMRQWTAWVLTAIALSPFALCFGAFDSGTEPDVNLSPVTGRITIGGHMVSDLAVCLDTGGQHAAYGWVEPDGSFTVSDMRWYDAGVVPGRYRAHFFTHAHGPHIPPKYREAKTSGIDIKIAPGWNGLSIDLR
jgi:hypothetical protein